MAAIPGPVADGAPYMLKVGDRINYDVRYHVIQIFSNHGPDVYFPSGLELVPRHSLPREKGREDVLSLLGELLIEQNVEGHIEPAENSHPSVDTYEVKA